jgi:hypothetical protein
MIGTRQPSQSPAKATRQVAQLAVDFGASALARHRGSDTRSPCRSPAAGQSLQARPSALLHVARLAQERHRPPVVSTASCRSTRRPTCWTPQQGSLLVIRRRGSSPRQRPLRACPSPPYPRPLVLCVHVRAPVLRICRGLGFSAASPCGPCRYRGLEALPGLAPQTRRHCAGVGGRSMRARGRSGPLRGNIQSPPSRMGLSRVRSEHSVAFLHRHRWEERSHAAPGLAAPFSSGPYTRADSKRDLRSTLSRVRAG